jgi:hypothetical protein
MPIPENFKYDVRVRERMLKRGLLTESELGKHVDALADVTDQVIEVELKQPALIKESERETRVVSRNAPRPVVAHVPSVRSLENELNDLEDDDDDLDDLDDEDDDEDDVKVKAKAAAAAAAPAAAAAVPAAAAAPAVAEPAEPKVEAAPAEPKAEEDGWESDK